MTIESATFTSEVAIKPVTGLYRWGDDVAMDASISQLQKGNETPIGRIDNTPVPQFLFVLFLGVLAWRRSRVDVIDSV